MPANKNKTKNNVTDGNRNRDIITVSGQRRGKNCKQNKPPDFKIIKQH